MEKAEAVAKETSANQLFALLITLRRAPQRGAMPFWFLVLAALLETLQLVSFAIADANFKWDSTLISWAQSLAEISRIDPVVGDALAARIAMLVAALLAVVLLIALLARTVMARNESRKSEPLSLRSPARAARPPRALRLAHSRRRPTRWSLRRRHGARQFGLRLGLRDGRGRHSARRPAHRAAALWRRALPAPRRHVAA